MSDSIFTKIINGEIPCYKIYEDDLTLAFLDIHPKQFGHTLVVPKVQIESVWDLPPVHYDALMGTVTKVASHLRQVTGKKFVGSKIIGTDVPHAHVHLFPFDPGDEYIDESATDAEPDHAGLARARELLAF